MHIKSTDNVFCLPMQPIIVAIYWSIKLQVTEWSLTGSGQWMVFAFSSDDDGNDLRLSAV